MSLVNSICDFLIFFKSLSIFFLNSNIKLNLKMQCCRDESSQLFHKSGSTSRAFGEGCNWKDDDDEL